MNKRYHTVLSIAGSDSIGGAGIQADIKTCTALGVYVMTVITAITAQNTLGVKCWEPVSVKLQEAQLDSVLSDVRPDAVKIGMLPDVHTIEIIVATLRQYNIGHIVVDPVLVSTSGHNLSDDNTKQLLLKSLFPLAEIITPNIPEALSLTGYHYDSKVDVVTMGLQLNKYCRNVLIKGGHQDMDVITDNLFNADGRHITFEHSRVNTKNTHGTGCSLSSAIACFLAKGESLESSVEKSIRWTFEAIWHGKNYEIGKGNGPINHMFRDLKTN